MQVIPLADVADGICKAVLAEGGNRATSRVTGRPETCVRRYGAKFPAYFVTWKEDQGKDRNTYIDLHHHLAMRRTE